MPTRPWRIPLPPTRLNNTSESPLSPASPLSPTPPISPQSTSPRSPNTQLTPPLRLHLRTIIPSPPLPKEYLKTAPPAPYPWIWRCHLCCSIYRLGVTRHCLEDGHLFCSLPSPPPSPSTTSAEEFFSSLSSDEGKSGAEIIAKLQAQKAKKKRSSRRGKKCHNERKAEREWEKQMREMREWEERWARENALEDDEDDDEVGEHERPESRLEIRDEDEDEEFVDAIDCEEEKKLPAELELAPVNGDMVAGMENLGPLGTDCDGLGEQIVQAEYCTKRRKSYDAAMGVDIPPNSPLKTCSFGFEDPMTGCNVWSSAGPCPCAGKAEDEGYLTDKDGDIQMKEGSVVEDILLRTIEGDVTEEAFAHGNDDEDVFEEVI
ncbi:uncharacterized protein PAC_03416 [Phialocephala subalpina]|uniref:Uncharacterized protein n=1 Tax=Phialocephala subalpina TaxID=576137 RepID=A0A1L7WL86_9HELO|nr:uncharacterized protein PAC_03416 [Phialocephala subalpina]